MSSWTRREFLTRTGTSAAAIQTFDNLDSFPVDAKTAGQDRFGFRRVAMSAAPLPEGVRLKLLNHFIGDVRSWKADDPAETIILGVKDPALDPNNTSFYALSRAGALTYIGTTTLGKDGGVQPHVYRDGTVVVLVTEAPAPGDSGSLADLYFVTLQYRLPPAPPTGGGVDQTTLNRITTLENQVRALTASLAALRTALHGV
jgi:hypothetical protein